MVLSPDRLHFDEVAGFVERCACDGDQCANLDAELVRRRIQDFVAAAAQACPKLDRVVLGCELDGSMYHLVLVVDDELPALGAAGQDRDSPWNRLFPLEMELWGDDRAPIATHIVLLDSTRGRSDAELVASCTRGRAVEAKTLEQPRQRQRGHRTKVA